MKHNVLSSGSLTGTTQVAAAATASNIGARLHSVQLIPDGTNACSVVMYNAASNTAGKEVAVLSIAALGVASQSVVFNNPIECQAGLRAVLGGTGGTVIVTYSAGS